MPIVTVKPGNDESPPILTQESSDDSLSLSGDEIDAIVKQLSRSADDGAISRVIALLRKTIIKLEQGIWQDTPCYKNLRQYQNTFKALEKLYELKADDKRYHFRIVIPVADRPQHLGQCLDSLLMLCHCYEYGGFKHGRYSKISVLIADDSRDDANIALHKQYCARFTAAGVPTEYFGREQQLALVKEATASSAGLATIISTSEHIKSSAEFCHKGASITRNITYLKLHQELARGTLAGNTLVYFIDSDQEFCINSSQSDDTRYAINYFHYLNEIFASGEVSVVTGKVVGDPPVSPAVMAANFQQDIKSFLNTISRLEPQGSCRFHQHQKGSKDDAAYHDMAELFGFASREQVFNYHCTLQHEHTNADCFRDFSGKLERFFYGEHPTRKTIFNYERGFATVTPARTVYTGNYVIRTEALKYFIPFATLKLRMAGPVLGRILKAELENKFVSANLPMLHNRTVDAIGQSEFRAGVKNHQQHIDLGNEFTRQFYGDVMLFTMEQITADGYPGIMTGTEDLQGIVTETYRRIRHNYLQKLELALTLKAQISEQLNDSRQWWNSPSTAGIETAPAIAGYNSFLHNIQLNFDKHTSAYREITSPSRVEDHLKRIVAAILQYGDDRKNWQQALSRQATTEHD